MVAVCVVANTLFPVVAAIVEEDAGNFRVTVRHENGSTDEVIPDAEVTVLLRGAHGSALAELVGRPWRAILSNLQAAGGYTHTG